MLVFFWYSNASGICILFNWEHVAQWIGCWLKIRRSAVRFPVLPCVKVSGKLCIPHCFSPPSRNGYLVHRSKVGSIVAGCIGTHLERGKVMSVEHVLSWSLGSKELPLPLPFNYQIISQQAFCSDKDYFILKLY